MLFDCDSSFENPFSIFSADLFLLEVSVVTTMSLSFDCFSILIRVASFENPFIDFSWYSHLEDVNSVVATISLSVEWLSTLFRVWKTCFSIFFFCFSSLKLVWERLSRDSVSSFEDLLFRLFSILFHLEVSVGATISPNLDCDFRL